LVREQDGSGPIQDWLAATAARHGIWLIGGSIPLAASVPDKVLNSSVAYGPDGKRVARYDKIHLFGFQKGAERYNESATIEAGHQPVAFTTPFGRIGLSICYDLRFPELYRALGEVDLLVIPAAFSTTPTCTFQYQPLRGLEPGGGHRQVGQLQHRTGRRRARHLGREDRLRLFRRHQLDGAGERRRRRLRAIAAAGAAQRRARRSLASPHKPRRPPLRADDPLASLDDTAKVKLLERLEGFAAPRIPRVTQVMAHIAGDVGGGAGGRVATATWRPTCARWCACRSR
jgi:hypothetical protein